MPEFVVAPARMQELVETLGRIGEQPEGGLQRPVYSPAWRQAREQLSEWMRGAGLQVREDAVGNLFGRMPGPTAKTVLTGSHLDTVKLGGRYDGALGILSALAAVEILPRNPDRSVEVVVLCEEEGSRFHSNFWGTRAILGLIDPGELESLVDQDGITIGQAMEQIGLRPDGIGDAARSDIESFIELHIEQGRILYDSKQAIGVVDTITGLYRFQVTVEGRTDHAGTTPMDLRRDALQAAAHLALEMTKIVEDAGRPAVLTNGWWHVQPGGWNIVPGQVDFSVDLRHPQESVKQGLAGLIKTRIEEIAVSRGVKVTIHVVGDIPPREMDPHVTSVLTAASEAHGIQPLRMVSGAGHDSQVMATRVPTGMLFVPSVEGRSHSAAEYTSAEDAARGASVLATALHRMAYRT